MYQRYQGTKHAMTFQSWLKRPWRKKLSIFVFRRTYLNRISKLRSLYQGRISSVRLLSYEAGYARCDKDKKHTLELIYQPLVPADATDSVVSSRDLPITESVIEQFKDDMRGFQFPTEDQTQLIYSQNRSTRVIAGAGAGKSTTLVLRVLMLHKYLKIPLNKITVFSFTKASCKEFQDKIIKVFDQHGITVTEDVAKSMVRTFHSKIREWTVNKIGKFEFFEFLNVDDKKEQKDEVDGGFSTKLNHRQRRLLKETYQNVFEENTHFQSCIRSLHKYSIRQSVFAPSNEQRELEEWRIRYAANRDNGYAQLVNEFFPLPDLPLAPILVRITTGTAEYDFYANRYYRELDLYVAFTPSYKEFSSRHDRGEQWPDSVSIDDDLALGVVSWQKCTILQRFSNVLTLSSEKECIEFTKRFESYNESLRVPDNQAPNFRYRITGEPSEGDIWELFYQLGTFIENVGLEVSAISNASIPSNIPFHDSYLLQALCLFWPKFDEHLSSNSIMRFHHGFAKFSERNPESYLSLTKAAKISMSHVMIDEFQDISPEIVHWIRGYLRFMRTQDASTSLMVVGDDDQSIYGWRGSDPQFITDFDKHFPTDSGCQKVSMSDNFRSKQEVVNAGEFVLKDVAGRDLNKHGICSLGIGGEVMCIPEKDENTVCTKLLDLWKEFYGLPEDDRKKRLKKGDIFLLVLSRTNNVVNKVKNAFAKALGVKESEIPESIISFMTFHRSKGLEADYCILLDDCNYNNHNPLKNFIYHSTGSFHQTYDEAQQDEAMRLAYVAITRTKYQCWWYGKPKLGGAMDKLLHA